LLVVACTGTLPEPPLGDGRHTGDEPQIVLSMPPPGKVQIAPPRPPTMRDAVWIDGEWEWTGRRWVWQDHGWQSAEPKSVYELPSTKRLPDGRLVHFAGRWKKASDVASVASASAAPSSPPVPPPSSPVPPPSSPPVPPPPPPSPDAG
jgi:hypothetical protein